MSSTLRCRRYEGFWRNGKQHGEGRYHHTDPWDPASSLKAVPYGLYRLYTAYKILYKILYKPCLW